MMSGRWEQEKTMNYELGCRRPLNDWFWLNGTGIFEDPSLKPFVAPFPPEDLVNSVRGGGSKGSSFERDFAKHGVDIMEALSKASPVPLADFEHILDFGCGCGRLARMFKGYPGQITGCDVNPEHIRWMRENLSFMTTVRTGFSPPLPFPDDTFDAVISISVFTHFTETTQDEFLKELRRITRPDGYALVTVHGSRALERAKTEDRIYKMLNMNRSLFEKACEDFNNNRYGFILQHGHIEKLALSSAEGSKTNSGIIGRIKSKILPYKGPFQYGISFIPKPYIHKKWAKHFNIVRIISGAIHDFQDIVVLQPKT